MQEGGGSFWAFSPYRNDINSRHDLIKEARRHVQRTCTGSTAPSNPICDTGPPTALSLLYDIDRFLIGSLRTSSAVQDFSIRSIVDRTAVAAPTMIDLVGAFRNSTAPINPINTNIQELRFPIQAEDGLNLEGGLRALPPPIGGRPYFERITQALIDTVEFNDTTAGDLSNGLNPANSQYRGIQIVQNTSESFIDNRRLQSFLEDIGISFDTVQARVAIASYGADSGDSTDSINRLINSQNRSMLNTIRRVLQHFAPITRDARNNKEFYMNDIAIWSWQFDGGDAILIRVGGDTFDKPLWCLIPSNLIVQNQDVRRFCRQDIPRDSRDSSVEAGEGAAVYPFSATGDGRRFAIGISGYQQIWLFDTRSGITSAQPISAESFGFLGYYCAERGRPETCTNTATRAVFDFVNDGKILLQRNRDGRFYIYNLEQRQRILNGLILDDEFIVYDSYGFYDASAEGAHYVYRFFPGLREHHSFAQFSRFFHRPDIVRSIVADRPFNRPRMELLAPPSIDFSARVFQSNARKIQLSFDIRASVPLRTVRLFRDGLPFAEIPLTGRASRLSREFELPDGRHNLTAVAYDERGFSSNSRSVPVQIGPDPRGTGQLRYVGIAVNEYPRMVADQNLRFAVRDAGLLRNTLLGLQGQRRGQIQGTVLADADATGESILSSLRRSAEQTGPDDVLVVSFAGHGAREGERFFFLPHQGSFADPAGSGVEWSAIAAALAPAQGRVLVLLDACHSGAARGDALIPNDAYAEQLMSSGRAGLAVLAAAKGRQFSFEDASLEGGHGFFSYMIARALGTDRATADRDRSGTIELDELYAFVRRNVSERTRDAPGGQTPWLAREEFIGRVSLF